MALSAQGLIGPIFVAKNVDGPVYRKILKKEDFPQFTAMKKFWNFGINRMGLRHTWLIWPWIWLKFTSRSVSFQTIFCSKKGGWSWLPYSPDLSPFDYFLWGYAKDRCYANRATTFSTLWKKYHWYFRLASRGSGHFLIGYQELPKAFRASCREGGWTQRKCYNLSCLIRVLLLNFVHSTIFKNFFIVSVYSERHCTSISILNLQVDNPEREKKLSKMYNFIIRLFNPLQALHICFFKNLQNLYIFHDHLSMTWKVILGHKLSDFSDNSDNNLNSDDTEIFVRWTLLGALKSSDKRVILDLPHYQFYVHWDKKTVHCFFSPDFSENYYKFFGFENTNFQFRPLIFPAYGQNRSIFSILFRLATLYFLA